MKELRPREVEPGTESSQAGSIVCVPNVPPHFGTDRTLILDSEYEED